MKVAEFMKRYEARHPTESGDYAQGRSPARQRAGKMDGMHTGTPFDWEDLARYQQELDRLNREGPERSNSH